MSMLELRGVTKVFNDFSRRICIQNASFGPWQSILKRMINHIW